MIRLVVAGLLASLLPCSAAAWDLDVSGVVAAEVRAFFRGPRFDSQPDATGSFSLKPEWYLESESGADSLLFVPFVRVDNNDTRRTHVDVRELSWIHVGDDWELRTGIRKVFWGVAESNHLVDIINQTDFVENIDFEDKLGQPMVNLALIRDWGTVDLFVLPGFRERTFPGKDGRFRFPLRVDTSSAIYESAAEQKHVDYAVRYSHFLGPMDFGIYHFWGTTREPVFQPVLTESGEPVLAPVYNLIHQTGMDVQATLGNWLLKFEALRRQGQGDTFVATVGGFEYTFVGVRGSAVDVGVLGEYHWDERGIHSPYPFNNDVFAGTRVAMNDVADSQLLGGVVADLNDGGYFLNIEASRRFGAYWKIELELRLLLDVAPTDPFDGFARDDHVQIEFQRFF